MQRGNLGAPFTMTAKTHMKDFSSEIARISGMNYTQIVNLHFALQEEIKKQYKLRDKPANLKNATELCEKSVAISGLVIEAMKKKHRAECDEYARATGRLSPNTKFYYPKHAAAAQLKIILKKLGKTEQIAYLEEKMKREGWGSGRIVDFMDL